MKLAVALLGGLALLLLTPERLLAFGPATHVYLGEHLLSSLYLLPPAVANVLRAYPLSFLYGSVAADISFAKKYVPAGRHSHYWHVGEEILAGARNDRLRAAGYGYLCHLAADTVAHNFYVPRQLMLTSSTKALGHSYWEHRLDIELGEGFTGRAREVVVEYDHGEADNLFDSILSGTIFSFETNRRIFRGMVRFQDNDRWHNVFGRVLDRSRWDLRSDDVEGYLSRSFDSMVDYPPSRIPRRGPRPDRRFRAPPRRFAGWRSAMAPPTSTTGCAAWPTISSPSPTTSSASGSSGVGMWRSTLRPDP